MTFTYTLQQTVQPLLRAADRKDDTEARAAAIVAHFAPYLLRRLAEIAAIFDAPGLASAEGTILACRSRDDGYRSVEYKASDLAIIFAVEHGAAHLRWRAYEELDDRVITMETPEAAIEATLLDAVSSYVNQRLAKAAI